MSLKNIVTKKTLDADLGHETGSPISGGVFTISTLESSKCKAGGAGIRKGEQTYTFSGGSASGFVPGSVATTSPQTISPSSTKVKVEGGLVILDGDSGTMSCTGTIPPPTGGTSTVSGSVKFTAQQSKVKGN